jgi:hypothetical protein
MQITLQAFLYLGSAAMMFKLGGDHDSGNDCAPAGKQYDIDNHFSGTGTAPLTTRILVVCPKCDGGLSKFRQPRGLRLSKSIRL